MARTFDGVNDNLLSADNAIPSADVDQKSFGLWVYRTTQPTGSELLFGLLTADGAGNGRTSMLHEVPAVSGYQVRLFADGTNDGLWDSPDISINARHHIAITYDRSSTTNNPTIYVDGTSVAVTEVATPVALQTGDDTLKLGEAGAGTLDFAGTLAHAAVEAGQLWDAAEVNRAMWWGRPHGGLQVYHPLLTEKLIDEGSAAETLTATGTTLSSFVTPCVRPGMAMMGMGVGW